MENKIKELRKGLGLRQEDLARSCEVSRQTIIAIENDKYDPSLEPHEGKRRLSEQLQKRVAELSEKS